MAKYLFKSNIFAQLSEIVEADSEKEVMDKIRNQKSFEIKQEALGVYPASIEIRKIKEKKEKNNMELKETIELMCSEDLSEFEEPCVSCKGRYKQDTMAYLKAKDCFKPKEEKADDEIDMVNHPPHYVGHGIEPIEFIESHNLNFCLGSAVKYIARAPYKGTELEDLKKAKWFLEREIKKHDKQ